MDKKWNVPCTYHKMALQGVHKAVDVYESCDGKGHMLAQN